ncbi:MAG TPA: helix-turn-helix domain-containing protein [Dehalococcoidia bacterium]|nr:helix-turn-helix domain-containing protein [Dehalococcoidia bacterium]
MIETRGMVSVAEAAKRLNRSTEQVRRNLRDGKLRGQRVGNQWFVDETCLVSEKLEPKPLIPRDLVERINRTRKDIYLRNGVVFDVVQLIREDRESH